MKSITQLRFVSWLSGALMLAGKASEAKLHADLSNKGKDAKAYSDSQFQKSDRLGTFSLSHVNCAATKDLDQKVIIRENEILHSDRHGNSCGLVGKIKWSGNEAWSEWLDHHWLTKKGISTSCVLYCRPIQMPGEKSIWLSFLPNRQSREPFRDEIYNAQFCGEES